MVMAFDGKWKYIHSVGLRPMLFDLGAGPQEMVDLGEHPDYEAERQRMQTHVMDWAYGGKIRITQSNGFIESKPPEYKKGILVGFWDEDELNSALSDD